MSSKLSMMRHAYAVGVGTAAGITSGLVGWGGAQIVIPSMIYPSPLANYSQLSATGISLSSLSLSSISSGYRFWSDNQVNIPLALSIGLPAVVSARIGSHIAKKLSGNALELFFNGFSLLLIPTHLWIQKIRSERDELVVAAADIDKEESTITEEDTITKTRIDERDELDAVDIDKEEEDTISKTRIEDSTSSSCRLMNDNVPIQATSISSITSITDAVRNNPLILQHVSFGTFSGILSSLMGVGGLPLTMVSEKK